MLIKSALGIATALAFVAHPALAEDTATSAQISSAVEGAAHDLTGTRQQEFSKLFSSWGKLDNGGFISSDGDIVAAPQTHVSIPSLVPVHDARVTSPFGMRWHPILGIRRMHDGIDLAAPRGTPVYATANGRVAMAQRFGGYGNFVELEHGGDLETRYGHLSSYTVHVGEEVHKGELIGYVGSTGLSTGPHLHYEVRVDGKPVNPAFFLGAQFAKYDKASGLSANE